MDFSQIKKTLYVFLAIRLILDVLAFIFGFTAGVDEDDDDSIKKCLESLGPLTALGEASCPFIKGHGRCLKKAIYDGTCPKSSASSSRTSSCTSGFESRGKGASFGAIESTISSQGFR